MVATAVLVLITVTVWPTGKLAGAGRVMVTAAVPVTIIVPSEGETVN
jgi:hypothetical protein